LKKKKNKLFIVFIETLVSDWTKAQFGSAQVQSESTEQAIQYDRRALEHIRSQCGPRVA